MLEIKDINKIKINNIDVDNIQFMYEDTVITLHDFKGVCTIIETKEYNNEEKKYKIIECKIEKFINKLTSLDTAKNFILIYIKTESQRKKFMILYYV